MINLSPRIMAVSRPIIRVEAARPNAKTEALSPDRLEETPRPSRTSAISG